MANNGFIVQGVCVGSIDYAYAFCTTASGFDFTYVSKTALGSLNAQCVMINGGVVTYSQVPSIGFPNCEISGPPLTEVQQIQAVNAILPAALAFLAVIWAGKKVFQVLWNSVISHGNSEKE